MTIAVGVTCPEGLVLAADSRSSLLSADKFRIATDYAQKVLEIGERFIAVTSGWSTLGGKTIAGVVKEFNAQVAVPPDIAGAAQALSDYIHERITEHVDLGYDPEPAGDILSFIVGGFDTQGIGHLKLVYLPSGSIEDGFSTDNPGVNWQGEIDVIVRLIWGYDLLRLDTTDWDPDHVAALNGLAYQTPIRWFALQDAVDFAAFVVRTTTETQRFTDGTFASPGSSPTCGGPLQIATVTSHDGVAWVQRTQLHGDVRPLRAEGGQEEP